MQIISRPGKAAKRLLPAIVALTSSFAAVMAAGSDAPASKPLVFDFPQPVSVQDLIGVLQQNGLQIIEGNAQDLGQKYLRCGHLFLTPEQLLETICKSANVNYEYDTTARVWHVNEQVLKLPPVSANGDTNPQPASPVSPPVTIPVVAPPTPQPVAPVTQPTPTVPVDTTGGTPVDVADVDHAPSPKLVEALIPVRYMDCRQLISVLMNGDMNSMTDPLSVLPVQGVPLNDPSIFPTAQNGAPAPYGALGGHSSYTLGDAASAASLYQMATDPRFQGGVSTSYSAAPSSNAANAARNFINGLPNVLGTPSGSNLFGFHRSEQAGDGFAQFPGQFNGGGFNGGGFNGGGNNGGGFNGGGFNGGRNGNQQQQQRSPFGTILPQGTNLLPYPLTNSILAFTTPEGLATLRTLVAQLDKRPPNILIRVTKLIVTENKNDQLGFDYNLGTPLFSVQSNTGVRGSSGTLNINYVGSNLSATLLAVASRGSSRVVATPRIILPDGVPGTISDTVTTHIVLPAIAGAAFSNGPIQAQVEPITTGFQLPILARLNWDGTVTIYSFINDTQSSGGVSIPGGTGVVPDITSVQFPVPGIRVENGDTIVLGGFSSNSTNHTRTQIPLLGDLPFIGPLFRNTQDTTSRSEALYFITVNVVDVHGQIIPGGGDAVRNELQKIESEGGGEDVTDTGGTTIPGTGGLGGIEGGTLPTPGGPAVPGGAGGPVVPGGGGVGIL